MWPHREGDSGMGGLWPCLEGVYVQFLALGLPGASALLDFEFMFIFIFINKTIPVV